MAGGPDKIVDSELVDAGDVVRRIGIPVTAMVMQSRTGKTLARFGGDPAEPIMQFVWRADLYRGLHDELVRRAIPTCLRDLPHDKAAGPVARILRDLFLPVAMKLLAKPEKMAWQFGYRIDWDAPVAVSASPYRAAGPQPRSTARPGS